MTLENKLGITDAVELARVEEKLSKTQAHKLFTSGFLDTLDAGSFLLQQALIDKIDNAEIYMKGIDASYYYEGYALYKTEEITDDNA